MFRFISRAASNNIRRAGAVQLASRAMVAVPSRAFSSAVVRANKTTSQLAEIVNSEYSAAVALDNELSQESQQFLTDSGFTVKDSKYSSNVELHKTLASGEEVRVYFDIDEVSDVQLAAPEFGLEEGAEDKEQFDEELDQYDGSFANIKVFVSKPASNDGLFFNLLLQNSEEELFVDYFNYKPNASGFLAQVQEQGTFLAPTEYQGPQFSNLDESLQLSMENYLEEKGINEELADFIFAYSEVKEERAYRQLLSNTSKFLGN